MQVDQGDDWEWCAEDMIAQVVSQRDDYYEKDAASDTLIHICRGNYMSHPLRRQQLE